MQIVIQRKISIDRKELTHNANGIKLIHYYSYSVCKVHACINKWKIQRAAHMNGATYVRTNICICLLSKKDNLCYVRILP